MSPHSLRHLRWVSLAVSLVLSGVTDAATQQVGTQDAGKTTVSLFVGGSEYDRSGVGWTAVFSPRVDRAVLEPLVVQFALPYYAYGPQFGDRVTYLLPELTLLLSPRIGPVSPYLGGGPGWSVVVAGPSGIDGLTLHGTVGVRVEFVRGWDLGSELRVRAIDPWGAATADISGGIGYRF